MSNRWVAASVPCLVACSAPPSDSAPPLLDPLCGCPNLSLPTSPVVDEAGMSALLAEVQTNLYPEASGATLGVAAHDDLQFFRAWTELDTVGNTPYERTYVVEYDPVVLADPPSPQALAAVLAHELGHIDDYLAMTSQELLDFAVWYGTQDPATSTELADYERATDEKALSRGCAEGLSEVRTWIYAHVSPDRLAEKEKDYYTPDEITAWVAENGVCED